MKKSNLLKTKYYLPLLFSSFILGGCSNKQTKDTTKNADNSEKVVSPKMKMTTSIPEEITTTDNYQGHQINKF